MRLTVAICCIINLHLTSYRVSAGYSDMVLNGPLPKLEDYSDGDGGSNKDQKSEYGDGKNGQQATSVTNKYGGFRSQRDVQEKGNSMVKQRKAKLAGTEGQVVFGRKRQGRFEFEDGERYEESGDSGDGRERNWYSGKGDGSENGEVDDSGHGEHPPAENQQHRGSNYTHRRRKNYTQLQRSQKAVGNKVNIGDLSRFRKIHKKHFGGGGGGEVAPDNTEKPEIGNGKFNHNQYEENSDIHLIARKSDTVLRDQRKSNNQNVNRR